MASDVPDNCFHPDLTDQSGYVSSTEDHFSDAPEGPHDHDDSSIPSPSPSAHTTNDSSTPQSTTAPEIMRLSEEAEKDPAAHGAFGSDGNDDKVWGIKTHPGKVVANGDAGSSAGPETPESPEIIVKWNEKQDVIHPKVRGERARIEQLVEAQREQRKNRSTSITSVRKSPSSGQEEGLNEMECEKKEKKEDAEAAIGDGVETIATTGGDAELITATGDEAKSDTAEAATPPLAENLVVCESDKNEESKDEESIASPRNDVKSETTRADTPPPEELEPATVPSPAPSQKSTETREATLASEFTPDPPTPIEQATFDISGAAVIGEEDDFGEEPVFDTPEAATGGDDFGDDFEGNAGGDDFDDFSYSVEADGDGFDDFDDFGGFEDGEGFDEPEEPTPPPPPPPPPPRVIIPPLPVPLPDFQNQAGLADALSSAAETMFPREISDPRKPSSIEGRSFLTERSLSLWNQLVAPPPLQPPNWKISRIRRLFLVSLGIPLDLDEILPTTKQKKLVLPSVHLPRHPGNSRSSSRNSRRSMSQSRRKKEDKNAIKPEMLDIPGARILCSTSPLALQRFTVDELREHIKKLEEMTVLASEVLTYWLTKRDGAVGDKETFETVIESLVGYARKKRQNG